MTFPEIAASFAKAYHFNTFGGSPLACAVGSSVLDVRLKFFLVEFDQNQVFTVTVTEAEKFSTSRLNYIMFAFVLQQTHCSVNHKII